MTIQTACDCPFQIGYPEICEISRHSCAYVGEIQECQVDARSAETPHPVLCLGILDTSVCS